MLDIDMDLIEVLVFIVRWHSKRFLESIIEILVNRETRCRKNGRTGTKLEWWRTENKKEKMWKRKNDEGAKEKHFWESCANQRCSVSLRHTVSLNYNSSTYVLKSRPVPPHQNTLIWRISDFCGLSIFQPQPYPSRNSIPPLPPDPCVAKAGDQLEAASVRIVGRERGILVASHLPTFFWTGRKPLQVSFSFSRINDSCWDFWGFTVSPFQDLPSAVDFPPSVFSSWRSAERRWPRSFAIETGDLKRFGTPLRSES